MNQVDTQTEANPNLEKEANKPEQKALGFFEVIGQALSLLFALQNKAKRERLMTLIETDPKPVLIAGLTCTTIFLAFCFTTSQFFIHLLTK